MARSSRQSATCFSARSPARPRGPAPDDLRRNGAQVITAEMRAEMRRLVIVEGLRIQTVARRFRVHHSVVRRAIRDGGTRPLSGCRRWARAPPQRARSIRPSPTSYGGSSSCRPSPAFACSRSSRGAYGRRAATALRLLDRSCRGRAPSSSTSPSTSRWRRFCACTGGRSPSSAASPKRIVYDNLKSVVLHHIGSTPRFIRSPGPAAPLQRSRPPIQGRLNGQSSRLRFI